MCKLRESNLDEVGETRIHEQPSRNEEIVMENSVDKDMTRKHPRDSQSARNCPYLLCSDCLKLVADMRPCFVFRFAIMEVHPRCRSLESLTRNREMNYRKVEEMGMPGFVAGVF